MNSEINYELKNLCFQLRYPNCSSIRLKVISDGRRGAALVYTPEIGTVIIGGYRNFRYLASTRQMYAPLGWLDAQEQELPRIVRRL